MKYDNETKQNELRKIKSQIKQNMPLEELFWSNGGTIIDIKE